MPPVHSWHYKFEFIIIKMMQSEAIIKKKKKKKKKGGIEYLGLSETEGRASVTGWATHQSTERCVLLLLMLEKGLKKSV